MDKVIVTVFVLVVFLSFVVGTILIYVPIQAKNTFDSICRMALLSMENDNGLSTTIKDDLESKLTAKGYNIVSISGTPVGAKKGDYLNLRVEALYRYRTIETIFTSKLETATIIYDRTTVARKIIY